MKATYNRICFVGRGQDRPIWRRPGIMGEPIKSAMEHNHLAHEWQSAESEVEANWWTHNPGEERAVSDMPEGDSDG